MHHRCSFLTGITFWMHFRLCEKKKKNEIIAATCYGHKRLFCGQADTRMSWAGVPSALGVNHHWVTDLLLDVCWPLKSVSVPLEEKPPGWSEESRFAAVACVSVRLDGRRRFTGTLLWETGLMRVTTNPSGQKSMHVWRHGWNAKWHNS